jgi:hypothetical protein
MVFRKVKYKIKNFKLTSILTCLEENTSIIESTKDEVTKRKLGKQTLFVKHRRVSLNEKTLFC